MRNSLLWPVTLSALVLSVATAFGDVRLNVENPTDGQDISGIVTISGWAFPTRVWRRTPVRSHSPPAGMGKGIAHHLTAPH
jgi:hypothetical protein